MANPDESAMWPGSPYDLADTHLCPACFSTLTSTTCGHCGLVLTDPRALRLLELGRTMLGLESERQQVIDQIRLAHVAAPPLPVATPETASWMQPSAAAHAAIAGPVELERTPEQPAEDLQEAVLAEPAPLHAAEAPVSAPTPIAAPVSVPPAPVPPIPMPPVEAAPVMPAPADPAPPSTAPTGASVLPAASDRRLTVPVLLLIVGVSLVGVAAVFFLGLAWFVAGIQVRALIIGGITAAAMVGASLLRRRSLTATAEAIAVLGVILLALDAYAVRANDFFGTADVDVALYAGVSALVVGVICRLWSLVSHLRGPDLAATLALPTGLGLLVAGLLPFDIAAAVVGGLVGAALGGLLHALPAPWSAARSRQESLPERMTLAVIGVAATVVGAAVALAIGLDTIPGQLVAALAVIAVGVAHAVLLRPRDGVEPLPAAPVLSGVASATAAVVATSLGWQLSRLSDLPVYSALAWPVVAAAVAVGLDRWSRPGRALLPARIASAAVAGVSVLALVFACLRNGVERIGESWTIWRTDVLPTTGIESGSALSAIAAVIVAVLVFLAPTLRRPGLRDARPLVATVLVIAGALGTGIPLLIVCAAIAVAIGAVVALARGGSRIGWGVAAGLAASTAFVAGVASPWLWTVGVLIAIAVPIAARLVVRPAEAGAIVLAVAPVAIAAAAAVIAPAAIAAVTAASADAGAAPVLLQWVALVALACAVALRLDAPSRTAVALSSLVLLLSSFLGFVLGPFGSVAGVTVSEVLGEPLLAIVRCAALVVLLVVIALRRTRIAPQPAVVAAALVAPFLGSAAAAVLDAFDVVDDVTSLVIAGTAALVVWAGALLPARAFGTGDAPSGLLPATAGDPHPAPALEETTQTVERIAARPTPYPVLARRALDIGALATAVAAVNLPVPSTLAWALVAVISVALAGASVGRSWAGPLSAGGTGLPEARFAGVPLRAAPRRLLAWPAFAAATAALWVGLINADGYELEAFVLPPAVGLLLFAAVLVWLRRRPEASVAIGLSFALGLVAPALDAVLGSAVRGTAAALAAAALTIVLAWSPLRRSRGPAVVGAATALVALGIVAASRASLPPVELAWLLLLVATAFAGATGFVLASRAVTTTALPSFRAAAMFAVVVPPLALAVAVAAALAWVDDPLVLTVALGVLGGLHLASAALDRLPLGAATRWTAFAGAVVAASGALAWGGVRAVEAVSLPLAAVLLGGAALAMWHRARAGREWPGSERIPWLAGLVLVVAPSVAAEPSDARTWLVIAAALLAALGCVVAPIAGAERLRTPSALVLTAGALAMGVRALLHPSVVSSESAALVAGAGALLIAAALIWVSETESAPPIPTWLGAAGAALVVLTVWLSADGELARTALTAIGAGVVGVGGAALLRLPRWAGIGAVLALGALVAAVLAVADRFALVVAGPDNGIEADLWALVGLGIMTAIGVMALRSTTSSLVARAVGVVFSLGIILFTVAELALLGDADADADALRTVLTTTALTVVALVGHRWRARLGLSLAVTAAALVAIFGAIALIPFGVRPVELVTVPAALGLLWIGVERLRATPSSRTWPTVGPGLLLLTLPSLLYDLGPSELWRVVGLGVVAIALVVIGAVWRLQAPLLLGSAVLLVHAAAQLWPWISAAYVAVPWWLWLGIGGALLIFIAARYEKRMRALRAAFTAVSSLR
ncbi:SCO7613 C-terminal domain-containing membrane protein [Microbacterium sp. CFBP9034]|uniref:SCO7613 C-terminal domain-containing membrane protein n=1 Tax=Microbacterium sp. CFBP9034 TaxID=3096540 RepID=UPI002A6A1D31|nr:hypothetical protein [Microbacterium sp. CFBP9034]MDY0908163.1 hypothetical protein [Microbacterium sp. CFBP9034]